MIELNKIHCVNALEGMKKLPDESIDCIVTSPPYWGLRDYGIPETQWKDGEKSVLGLEKRFVDYVDHLIEIFDEIHRVLKPTGTLWVNLGDTYCGDWRNYGPGRRIVDPRDKYWDKRTRPPPSLPQTVPKKSLCLIPERFVIRMVEKGWTLRNRIVWHKPNHMPSSVKDRLSCSWEYFFLFSKASKYYFALDAIREPHKESTFQRMKYEWHAPRPHRNTEILVEKSNMCHPRGKNPGDYWAIGTKSSQSGHYAVYPEELCERPIKAGCPDQVCIKCGTPQLTWKTGGSANAFNIRVRDTIRGRTKNHDRKATDKEIREYKEEDYVSQSREKVVFSCDCKVGFSPGIVLDPFMGSGTTAVVAEKLGRQYIGFELNRDYVEMANKRLATVTSTDSSSSKDAA